MNELGPTILVTPQGITQPPGFFSWELAAAIVMVVGPLVIFGWMYTRRYRRLDARERAFRTLSKRVGLTRAQTRLIRQYADTTKTVSPVGVLMSPVHTDAALASTRASEISIKAISNLESKSLSVSA